MALAIPIESNKKEVFYETTTNNLVGNSAVGFIFPPTDLYNNNGEVLEEYKNVVSDKVNNVDIAFLKLKNFEDGNQDSKYDNGDFKNTNVAGAFFAVGSSDYFYVHNTTETTLAAPLLERSTTKPTIAEAIKLPHGSTGATFENKSLSMSTANVNRFDDIEVDGLNEGYKPSGMSMIAVRLEKQTIEDVTYRCFDSVTITTPRTTISSANTIQAQIASFSGIANEFVDENSNKYVDERVSASEGTFVDSSSYVSAVEIINVERELDDNRYGDDEDDYPFIFTGASHYFTDAELNTTGGSGVSGGSSVPIDIDVWGGDCFIGLHTFKISNSAYALTDPEKDVDNTGVAGTSAIQIEKWGHYFKKDNSDDVSRPFPLKGVSQTITVLLESEINPYVAEKDQHNEFNYDVATGISTSNLPLPIVDDAGQIRSNFKYYFNLDYARANEYKVFFPYKTYEKNNNTFGARMPYSDQKIYNTDIEGFDRFRALSFYDLDESHGSGAKLVELKDKIFAIQESAVSYIPIKSQIIETADGSNISIRSDEIIGTPNKIDVLYGTKDPKTVKYDSNVFIFADKVRGDVCMFDGSKVVRLSQIGMEDWFNNEFSSSLSPANLTAVYDSKKKEYIIYFRNGDSAVFNLDYGVWTGRYPETSTANTLAGASIGNTFIGIGIDGSKNVIAGSLYTGAVGNWWGTTFTPYVNFFVSPEPDSVKTFDAFTLISDRIPSPQSFDVILDDGTVVTADLSTETPQYQEGSYRFKNVRVTHEDGVAASASTLGRRLKGTYGEMKIEFITSEQSGTTSAITKYRPSNRVV